MKAIIVDGQRFRNPDFTYENEVFRRKGFKLEIKSCSSEEDIIEQCKDANVIMNLYTQIGKKAIDALTNCKAMIRYGIGFDVFDVSAATQRGIMICNVPDYCIPEVATHSASLILASARQLLYHTTHIRNGTWKSISNFPKKRLSNQVLGFVGFGNIAVRTAIYLKSFGFEMIAYDPFLPNEKFTNLNVKKVDIEELCKRSDIISVHIPLNEQTFHFINEERIQTMKDGVIIVNTSRGSVICEEDLIKAITNGKVAAAGLDVFEKEPFEMNDHALFHMDNVILTPHISYDSVEASQMLRQKVADMAIQVLSGDIPYSVINRKELGL